MQPQRFQPTLAVAVALGVTALGLMDSRAQARNPYIVVDANQKKILIENDADRRLAIASLTKIATALVALDWIYSQNIDKNSLMVVPASAVALGGANPFGLQPGDQISIRDALYAALMASDNVCAQTVADHVGRQMMARVGGRDPVRVFVDQMNALAHALGMTKTKFTNPHGLDHQGPIGLSTPRDLARLMIYGLRNPSYNFIIAQSTREVTFLRGGQPRSFNVTNTNKLLGQYGVDGGKTGSTQKAGDCLITTARKPDRFVPINATQKRRIAYRLVTVVLASPDRFGQTAGLIQQGWNAYESWIAGGMLIKAPGELLTVAN
ncbi:MAG: D-alanyl-D-alanine carboxypeptidase [Verrucomicrobiales bacterium]|nr:D-alanyl-D-alanine carboxypeptidase [Verrucomicrobiales bacterium]